MTHYLLEKTNTNESRISQTMASEESDTVFFKCWKKRTVNTESYPYPVKVSFKNTDDHQDILRWEKNKTIWLPQTYCKRMSKDSSLNRKKIAVGHLGHQERSKNMEGAEQQTFLLLNFQNLFNDWNKNYTV